jgi:hypothetical protein
LISAGLGTVRSGSEYYNKWDQFAEEASVREDDSDASVTAAAAAASGTAPFWLLYLFVVR